MVDIVLGPCGTRCVRSAGKHSEKSTFYWQCPITFCWALTFFFLWRENAFYAHNFVLRCVVEQHVEARMALEESAGKTLVYCAADDAVWGIARSISDPARFLPSRWGGRNELGKSMMAVRAEISGGSPSVPPKQLQLFTQLLE